ncbi:MAG: nickel-dependent lactate racemase [Deltaproteobacteria bacterium]|nr:nickel-dependent lactate racemase [Deltaproteobacteria bacterium]
MEIELRYGDGRKQIKIPDHTDVTILKPAARPTVPSIAQSLEETLANPLGCESFQKMLQQAAPKTIGIAVPDETRPVPLHAILPLLLEKVRKALPDLATDSITIVIGGGLHSPLEKQTQAQVLPDSISQGCRVIAHDARQDRMVDYGLTSRKTPVRINAEFAETDFKIVIGQIDPHQFVGFTGGAKGVVIGCAAAETIQHNHSFMFHQEARVGKITGNPVREDLNEAGEMVGIHLALNVVLDANKNVIQMIAGKPHQVLETGAETCSAIYGVGIDEKFDIVIASCGGHPKDICLYQAQKGLNLASQALRPGGHILLLAASPQGVGDDIYFDYVSQFTTPEDVLRDFKKTGFQMGAHKAYLFGRTLADFDVAIASDLDPGVLRKCHLRAAEPTVIVNEWLEAFSTPPRIAVVPNANTTYFYPV